jgi:hypothetical protein
MTGPYDPDHDRLRRAPDPIAGPDRWAGSVRAIVLGGPAAALSHRRDMRSPRQSGPTIRTGPDSSRRGRAMLSQPRLLG